MHSSDNYFMGKMYIIVTLLPVEPFMQQACLTGYSSRRFPWIFGRLLMYLAVQTLKQDKAIWEHKSFISPRNLVVGDGPFAAYGKWLQQFYSKESVGFEETSLDW
jgi:hypothetical protein